LAWETHPQTPKATLKRIARVELHMFLTESAIARVLDEEESSRKVDRDEQRTMGPEETSRVRD